MTTVMRIITTTTIPICTAMSTRMITTVVTIFTIMTTITTARASTVVELAARHSRQERQAGRENRGWFAGRGILALNLVSSPGAGKTTLLERTIRDLKDELPISVIEGRPGDRQ